MKKTFLFAKLHRATVTGAELNYEGSFGIDAELLDASGIQENEQIHVFNLNNGERFVTYAIRAPYQSRAMIANGACAHKVKAGDRVIICSYVELEKPEWGLFLPTVLYVDENNNFVHKGKSQKSYNADPLLV